MSEPPPVPDSPAPHRPKNFFPSGRTLFLWLLTALLLLLHFFPSLLRLYPGCPLHRLTGLLCPGCGGLRALQLLSQGHPLKALRFNLLPVIILAFLLAPPPYVRQLLCGRFFGIAILCILLYGILRNLPWAPFVLLAPP